jgi:SPP1 gp7 family putative phage head morphogenesis protein
MLRELYNSARSLILAASGRSPEFTRQGGRRRVAASLVLADSPAPEIKRPESGRLVYPMKSDAEREYVSVGLTPAKLVALMKGFDGGDLAAGLELAVQMEEKDLHLASVANTRRLALTGLPWEIVSAADIDEIDDRNRADEAAQFCKQALRAVVGLDKSLRHLSLAVGRNLSVAEIVWGPEGLEDIVPTPHTRLLYKLDGDEPELRVLTKEQAQDGIRMDPAKWLVHAPHSLAGLPMWGGLLRASAAAYVVKAFSVKDWLVFVELFGMPVRIAKYEPGATAKDKEELLGMLRSLGTDAAGIFSKAVELELKETSKQGESPYERVCSFFNAELSKAWLGQTLTTEVGDSGSRALGDVHNEVRKDLLADDIRNEGDTVREQLLSPMVQFRFGPDCPVPYFRRRIDETRDPLQLCDVVERASRMGSRISRTWFEAELGLQTTDDDDDVLQAPPAAPASAGLFPNPEPRTPNPDEDDDGLPLGERRLTRRRCNCSSLVLSSADQNEMDAAVDATLPAAGRAHQALLGVVGDWIDAAIAAGISTAAGLSGFLADQVATGKMPVPQQIADQVESLIVLGNLEGRVAVSSQLSAFSQRKTNRRTPARTPKPGTRTPRSLILAETDFENRPFAEAIAALAERVRMPRDKFDELSRQAKSKAFTVAWVDSARMLGDIHEAAIAAMMEGETLRDFRLRLPDMAEQSGWTGERPWHADLVYRQQSMMATQAGRFSQMADAGLTHWQYSSLLDGRVRPEHAALDGKVFAMADRTFYPPWDFNCRCVAEPAFEGEFEDNDVSRSDELLGQQVGSNPETGEPIRLELPGGEHPFEWDPAAFAASPTVRLETISEPLRTAVKDLLNGQGIQTEE